ncbi:ABC transporter ATP-binding protein [Agrobacterium rubi]|uniref:ABC transporter ATP-binding protein n=1 Tax=Agrobacterium rubi TaxID=28099 RepID=A0AAE7R5H4_9HYPH|nr:ABC transporter ATP-binding protein [Agrobacterium rubi]NTE87752.1 ABC transporter ATP-binding protein [Agrobacterium rubi]NTF05249.1 ABC transporter ATP-binding protein [Agrobacterium rubi]NTF37846.1 ABC transporter ATP-binding protein [Agrobacterium rubi]OCJ54103.1 peptide ABC transporter ATP-binding protein [Agrobacterium rubi]QTG01711.1 ABC transporter ATP-binding protein [Agrobacterium rubi]
MVGQSAPLLHVEGLRVSIDGATIVDGIDLSIKQGEILAIVGESGCGKSMTALSILGLLPDAAKMQGDLRIADRDVGNLRPKERLAFRSANMSVIFQEPIAALNPLMPVGDQIAEALILNRGTGKAEAKETAIEIMRRVGISDPERRYSQYAFELSGGMCQRVSIAAALISKPKLLIADEPTTALDVTIQASILDLMKSLRQETGMSILLITHDMGVVAEMADRVAVMYAGRIVETGLVDDVFAAPAHPYTKLLLTTIPKLSGERKTELNTIKGTVPDVGSWPAGCRFRNRCPLSDAACETQPATEPAPNGNSVGEDAHLRECWHAERTVELA